MTVTGNVSCSKAKTVIGNDCKKCAKYWRGFDWHCSTCHSDDHCECVQCHACLPHHHRHNRRYCSSTCRVKALKWRRGPEGQEDERKFQEWLNSAEARLPVQILNAMTPGDPEKRKQRNERFRRAFITGETCAACGVVLGPGLIYRRRVATGLLHGDDPTNATEERRSAVVCANCSCDHGRAWLCELCRPAGGQWEYDARFRDSYYVKRWACPEAGEGHRDLYCQECHPRTWVKGTCPGCERTVNTRPHANLRYQDDDFRLKVFCSQRCRSRFNHDRASTRRLEKRIEAGPVHCAECDEVMEARRSDSTFCSSACRQRAYRQRRRA